MLAIRQSWRQWKSVPCSMKVCYNVSMEMDLSSLGILVKDAQGNLQEQKLEQALGGVGKPATQTPTVSLRGAEATKQSQPEIATPPFSGGLAMTTPNKDGLHNFRQQLSKVTGETGYSLPKKQASVVIQQSAASATSRPHLSSTVEELGSLKLEDIRRWGTAAEITRHLSEMVALLHKDSLAKRAAGVRAWQRSPVHQLYLEVGRQSMREDKPLGQIVDERTKMGLPTLRLDEFEALMEANEQLRF